MIALSPSSRPDAPDHVVPTLTIHCARGHASHVDLPVIPR
jgi:hypothetical protein